MHIGLQSTAVDCSPHPVHENHGLDGLHLRSPSKRPDGTRSWQSVQSGLQSGPDYVEHCMKGEASRGGGGSKGVSMARFPFIFILSHFALVGRASTGWGGQGSSALVRSP